MRIVNDMKTGKISEANYKTAEVKAVKNVNKTFE